MDEGDDSLDLTQPIPLKHQTTAVLIAATSNFEDKRKGKVPIESFGHR